MGISSRTRAALERLEQQIAAAEKELKKMPGSRSVVIAMDDDSEMRFGVSYSGEVEGVIVQSTGRDPEYLSQMPVSERVDYALSIPSLIEVAKAAEDGVADKAEQAADHIEQAIAAINERQPVTQNRSAVQAD